MPAVHVPENDPKKQEQKSQRNESMHAYAARRESEIESLRELRQQLNALPSDEQGLAVVDQLEYLLNDLLFVLLLKSNNYFRLNYYKWCI